MRFIFVFGVRPRETTLRNGSFLCPACGVERHYVLKQVRPYVTFYFIPVIPVGKENVIVQCQTCQRSFDPDVLSSNTLKDKPKLQSAAPLSALMNTAESRLRIGKPVEDLLRELTACGLDRDVAREFLGQYLKPDYGHCSHCSLRYHASAAQCADCGRDLDRHNLESKEAKS